MPTRRSFLEGMCCLPALSPAGAVTGNRKETDARVTRALRHFRSGYHCSQSILLAYAGELGFDADQALRISAALAGGSTVGGECGVIGGGYLILGLKYGAAEPAHGDVGAEDRLWSRVRRFTGEFRRLHGAITCRELLGVDVFSKEGRDQALRQNLFVMRCPRYIRDGIGILDSLEAVDSDLKAVR